MNKFTVPKPCHENWETMLPEEKGRFCTFCKTKVYDFSKSSDAEIQEIYDAENGNICGRFDNEQLVQYSKFQRIALRFQNFSQDHFSRSGIFVSAASLLMSISGCTKKTAVLNTGHDENLDPKNRSIDTIQNITLGSPLAARSDSAQLPKENVQELDPIEKTIPVKVDKSKNANVKPPKEIKDITNVPPRAIDHSQGFPLGKIAPVKDPIKTETPKEVPPPIIVGKPMRDPKNN